MSASGIEGYDGMPASVEDLLRYPLLNPYDDWGRWFRKAGVPMQSMIKGRTFENISSLLNAVENGQGIALAHKWLVGDAIDGGRLVRLPGPSVPARRDYSIVYPKRTTLSPATRSFIAWLHETAATERLTVGRHRRATRFPHIDLRNNSFVPSRSRRTVHSVIDLAVEPRMTLNRLVYAFQPACRAGRTRPGAQ